MSDVRALAEKILHNGYCEHCGAVVEDEPDRTPHQPDCVMLLKRRVEAARETVERTLADLLEAKHSETATARKRWIRYEDSE